MHHGRFFSALRTITLGAAIASVTNSGSSAGQSLREASGCLSCSIMARPIVALGAKVGPGRIPALVQSIGRDARGDWWISSYAPGTPIQIFDEAGTYIGTAPSSRLDDSATTNSSLIRRGPGDSVFVLDAGRFVLNVFDPRGRLVRSVELKVDGATDMVPLPGGNLVFAADMPTPAAVGYPLHLFGPDGTPLRSFGADIPVYRADAPRLLDRRLAAATRPGYLWSVQSGRYVLDLMDPTGRSVLSLSRGQAGSTKTLDGSIQPQLANNLDR